jgi:hypothetical protein
LQRRRFGLELQRDGDDAGLNFLQQFQAEALDSPGRGWQSGSSERVWNSMKTRDHVRTGERGQQAARREGYGS